MAKSPSDFANELENYLALSRKKGENLTLILEEPECSKRSATSNYPIFDHSDDWVTDPNTGYLVSRTSGWMYAGDFGYYDPETQQWSAFEDTPHVSDITTHSEVVRGRRSADLPLDRRKAGELNDYPDGQFADPQLYPNHDPVNYPFPHPSGFTPTAEDPRYSYFEAADVWFDASTGIVSRYDPTTQIYEALDPTSTINLLGQVAAEQLAVDESALRLVVLTSPVLPPGKIVVVDSGGLTIGRDRSFERRLRLPELSVSKFHAHVYMEIATVPLDETEAKQNGKLDGLPPNNTGAKQYVDLDAPEKPNNSVNILLEQPAEDGEIEDVEDAQHVTKNIPSYCIVDVGSTQGTFVNGARLSESKAASQPCILNHLDVIELGGTRLEVHLHEGFSCETCRGTSETLIKIDHEDDKTSISSSKVTGQDVPASKRRWLEDERLDELQRLKRKYAGESTRFDNGVRPSSTIHSYVDRAALRRELKPDKNPYISNHGERSLSKAPVPTPPQAASAPAPRLDATNNIGARLLEKMGWSSGQGLGSASSGIVEPVSLISNVSGAGLGSTDVSKQPSAIGETLQQATRRKARERFMNM